jgi:hypothetical protein
MRRKQARKVSCTGTSHGARRSLGRTPFCGNAVRYCKGQLFIGRMTLSLWDSYGLADCDHCSRSHTGDALHVPAHQHRINERGPEV